MDLLSDLKISAYTITPRMFASALVHYNSSTTSVETNARLRWEYTPGSDLFVSSIQTPVIPGVPDSLGSSTGASR